MSLPETEDVMQMSNDIRDGSHAFIVSCIQRIHKDTF